MASEFKFKVFILPTYLKNWIHGGFSEKLRFKVSTCCPLSIIKLVAIKNRSIFFLAQLHGFT